MNERDKYGDIVKGLGIITVVLGHTGVPNIALLYIINYFHMSLFFFVSGFFYNQRNSLQPLDYIFKKIRTIWIPTMKYVIIFILLNNIFIHFNIYSTEVDKPMIYTKQLYSYYDMLNKSLEALLTSTYSVEMAGAMWFVFPLIGSMSIFCIIDHLSKRINFYQDLMVFYLCFVLGLFGAWLDINSYKLIWRIDISLLVLPIINIGFLIKRINFSIYLKWYLFLASIFILIFFYRNGLEVSYAAGIIGNPISFYCVTLVGIYSILYLANLVNKNILISNWISYAGSKSFHIMVLYFLAFKIINYIDVIINRKEYYMISQFPTSNRNWWYAYLIASLTIPMGAAYCYNKLYKMFRSKDVA